MIFICLSFFLVSVYKHPYYTLGFLKRQSPAGAGVPVPARPVSGPRPGRGQNIKTGAGKFLRRQLSAILYPVFYLVLTNTCISPSPLFAQVK